MLVVDTSAVVDALAGRPPDERLLVRLGADGDLHAPHLLDVELLHALRGLVAAGHLSEDRAADARSDFADLTIVRYEHGFLADRIWELRYDLTAYDAAFVALSEALGVPLVTCDRRLAGAPGHTRGSSCSTANDVGAAWRAADPQGGSMRRILAFLVTTVDGYYEGPNQEFDWPVVDEEFNEFGLEQLEEVDTLLFGRVTYEGMAAYWPTPAAVQDDPRVAAKMNSLPKVVVSRTLDHAGWANTLVLRDDVASELTRLKQQPGKDIAILGSSDLTVSLLGMGLVDELRIMVHPVVLGAGRSLFRTATGRFGLRLVEARPFRSGSVLLCYRPAGSDRA